LGERSYLRESCPTAHARRRSVFDFSASFLATMKGVFLFLEKLFADSCPYRKPKSAGRYLRIG
jgi:hypothetical protein